MSNLDMNPVINPIYWSTQQLISYGHDTIHELALNAAGTINSYHLVLGRCLLAVQRIKLYEVFGCSGAVHYGTQVLGLRAKQARAMRLVAQRLEELPLLSRAGELGEVGWSKLRSVVRRATPETEKLWLELCRRKNDREIAELVRHTPEGGIPGDLPANGDREPAVTDLRLQLGITARTVIERGLQLYSLEQGRPIPLAEAVEALFAKLVQKERSSATEIDVLSKSQEEARKDLLAENYAKKPLLREARKLAQSMGLGVDDGETTFRESESDDEERAADTGVTREDLAQELLDSIPADISPEHNTSERPARGVSVMSESDECPAQVTSSSIESSPRPARVISDQDEETEQTVDSVAQWNGLLAEYQVACPDNDKVAVLANDWRNRRLRFNENARLATPAQRREILRRDGYCCSTPGCPNHLWLEVHHIVFYSRRGKTIPSNTTAICGSCHRNVHRGYLKISGQAPDKLVFQDRHGNDLRRTHALGVAGWLDYWLGWKDGAENSHQHRWGRSEGGALVGEAALASPA